MQLTISEHFYSIQGEGFTVGHPSVFIRLAGCPLNCKWCDTEQVWKTGTKMDLGAAVGLITENYLEYLSTGAHLVLTGGDPLLQQRALGVVLAELYNTLDVEYNENLYTELETEGVILPKGINPYICQYNVSVKLANSGVPEQERIKEEVILFHAKDERSYFKFVVEDEKDMMEISLLQSAFNLDPARICIMPCCSTRADHIAEAAKVAELAKQFRFRFSPRMHLLLWNQAVGV